MYQKHHHPLTLKPLNTSPLNTPTHPANMRHQTQLPRLIRRIWQGGTFLLAPKIRGANKRYGPKRREGVHCLGTKPFETERDLSCESRAIKTSIGGGSMDWSVGLWGYAVEGGGKGMTPLIYCRARRGERAVDRGRRRLWVTRGSHHRRPISWAG